MVMTVSVANTFSSKVLLTRSWICRANAERSSVNNVDNNLQQTLTSTQCYATTWTGSFPGHSSDAAAHAHVM